MRDVVVDEIIRELSKEYNKKDKVIQIMLEKSMELGYDIIKSKENIVGFIKSSTRVDNVNNLSTIYKLR